LVFDELSFGRPKECFMDIVTTYPNLTSLHFYGSQSVGMEMKKRVERREGMGRKYILIC
jgi:hypothetical protein